MKIYVLRFAFFVISLILSPLAVVHASPPPDGVLFCQPLDFEQWLRANPVPATKRVADLNVGEPRTVRMIYFLPNDRQPQPDIDAKLDTLIKDVHQSYAEVMEYHGFGRRTFRFETDATGKAVVHHVKGKFNDEYYHTEFWGNIWQELGDQFDLSANSYLVVLDVSTAVIDIHACGLAAPLGPEGGMALIPAPNSARERERGWSCFNVGVAAHELGHTFGLQHDRFRNATRSPSSYHNDWMLRSFCAAEWLDAHRYFNIGQTYPEEDEPTTIQMLPPLAVPPNAIRLRFEVTDPDGLHQAQLHSSFGSLSSADAIDCQGLDGESASIEFVTSVMTQATGNKVKLRVVDVYGNVTEQWHPIDFSALLPPEVVSIPDANLASVVRETLNLTPGDAINQLDLLRLVKLEATGRQITDLTGLEHAVNLTRLFLTENQIRDITPLAGLVILEDLHLIGNTITDISPLARLTNLTSLWLHDNTITDISPLAKLTNLKNLGFDDNSVLDISPLERLTHLTFLALVRNSVLDISPLVGLTHLRTLYLWGNPLSYISVKTHIPALQSRGITVHFDIRTPTTVKIFGDGQVGTPGSVLAEPLGVEVRDQNKVAFEGVPVTFAVTAGGGTLSIETTTTDSSGTASSVLTLGRNPGTNTVSATVAELDPVTFTAVGQATPDFDGDGVVGISDFLQFVEQFGLSQSDAGYDARFDLDGDGTIGIGDFLIFVEAFGQ